MEQGLSFSFHDTKSNFKAQSFENLYVYIIEHLNLACTTNGL